METPETAPVEEPTTDDDELGGGDEGAGEDETPVSE
jgi:hypothetical protein